MSNRIEHLPHLAVASFVDADEHDGLHATIGFQLLRELHVCLGGLASIDDDAGVRPKPTPPFRWSALPGAIKLQPRQM